MSEATGRAAVTTEAADVVIDGDVIRAMATCKAPVAPHVALDGLQRVRHGTVAPTAGGVLRAGSLDRALLEAMRFKERWEGTGLFDDVAFSLEPLADGAPQDVLFRFHMTERRAKQEVGVTTTDTMVPEVKAQWFNLFGRAWDLNLFFTPASNVLQRSSGNFSLVSHAPWLGGRRWEVYAGRHVETRLAARRSLPIADSDETTEARVQWDLAGPPSGPTSFSRWTHSLTAGLQLRRLHAADASSYPAADRLELGDNTKAYVRWAARHSTAVSHQHPFFASVYSLPVAGHFLQATAEVAGAGAVGDAHHVKAEVQAVKFVPLLGGVTLDLNAYAGQVWSLDHLRAAALGPGALRSPTASAGPSAAAAAAADSGVTASVLLGRGHDRSRVRLADRLFLSWRHVRGYRATGPANVAADGSPFDAADVPRVFRPMGGNAAWALSASLNLPFLLWPDNGSVATHVFANAGQCRAYAHGVKEFLADPASLLQHPDCSVGAGFVITRFPQMFSPLRAGRFEVNWSVPVSFGTDWSLRFNEALNPRLFKSFRWGLHWTALQ